MFGLGAASRRAQSTSRPASHGWEERAQENRGSVISVRPASRPKRAEWPRALCKPRRLDFGHKSLRFILAQSRGPFSWLRSAESLPTVKGA